MKKRTLVSVTTLATACVCLAWGAYLLAGPGHSLTTASITPTAVAAKSVDGARADARTSTHPGTVTVAGLDTLQSRRLSAAAQPAEKEIKSEDAEQRKLLKEQSNAMPAETPRGPGDDYCTASSTYAGCDEFISRVQVGAIDNGTGCTNYGDYTSLSTDMVVGTGYPITVTNGPPSYSSDQCRVWVDWNRDLDFDDAGETFTMAGSPGTGPYTGTITPPAGTATGLTRMRVRINYNATPPQCGTTTYGEVEDYSINVLPPAAEGACCFGTTCQAPMTQAACASASGVYKGDGSTCTPNPCFGACCFLDGSCLEVIDATACTAAGGINFSGEGSNCTPNLCPQPGADCGNPAVVTLGVAQLPWILVGATNCGYVNTYNYPETTHCLYYYDSGEDIHYKLIVTEAMDVTLTLDPKTTTYAGFAIGYSCPPMDNCIAAAYGSGATPKVIGAQPTCLHLEPGEYYIMVDTWASPNCIPVFDLKIEQCIVPTGACCVGETCTIESQAACTALGGTYMGTNVPCDPNPCSTRACCLPAGECQNLTEADCTSASGVWYAAETCGTFVCPPPNDLCADATVVTDGVPAATGDNCTGTDDGAASCQTNSHKDVWFVYTATCTGTVTMSTENSAQSDTVLSVLTACGGTEVACDDDAGTTPANSSLLTFDAVAGTSYIVRVASYGTGCGGYNLNIICSAWPQGACCLGTNCYLDYQPTCVTAGGLYLGDDTVCSTLDCNNNGIDDACDIATGVAQDCNSNNIPDECDIANGAPDVDLNGVLDECDPDCNGNGILDACELPGGCATGDCDTAYPGACGLAEDCQPNGIPDDCELGRVGLRYTYQIGDGVSEDGLGITVGADLAALVGYEVAPNAGKITSISIAWGGSTNGSPATVYVWSDPNQDGNPADAVVLGSAVTTTQNSGSDTFVQVPLSSAVLVGPAGTKFFVGFIVNSADYVIALDMTAPVSGRNWLVGSAYATPPIDPNDLGSTAYNVPLSTTEGINFAGNLFIRAEGAAAGADCNNNNIPDDCDVQYGSSLDCNNNSIPDECELVGNDCNDNDIPDDCELAGNDCNANGIPDDCDIALGTSSDCQGDTIPDECQLDTRRDVVLTEGFEGGVVPPAGWTEQILNAAYNWKLSTTGTPHSGTYVADVEYDETLAAQDEWLLTPSMTLFGNATVSGWSNGSVYWGVTPNDNYDLEAWIVIGATAGDGDDTLLGKIDQETWVTNWVYAPFTYTFTAPDGAFRIGFRYVGADGAQAVLDDIQIDGSAGAPANDCNINGIPDECDIQVAFGGYCQGTTYPPCDTDYNANGVPDHCEVCGDLDGDGDVDSTDYYIFVDAYGTCFGHVKYNGAADLNGDFCINLLDYQAWLTCYRMYTGRDFSLPKPKTPKKAVPAEVAPLSSGPSSLSTR